MTDARDEPGESPQIAAIHSWAGLMSAEGLTQVRPLARSFAAQVSASDLDHLLWYARFGSDPERLRAFAVLLAASRLPQRLSAEQTQRLLEVAREAAQTYYPKPPIGTMAYQTLFEQDRPAAERFLLAECDFDAACSADPDSVITDLTVLKTEGAIVRLRQLAARSDDVGSHARRHLERLGLADPQIMAQAFENWRGSHTTKALARAYNLYFARIREGHPVTDVLEKFGPPTGHEGVDYWYDAADSETRFWFQGDAEHGLTAWKLMD